MTDPYIERHERAQALSYEIKSLGMLIEELDKIGLRDVVRYCQELSKWVGASLIDEARSCAAACLQAEIYEIEQELKSF